jgi:hypothetical protein
VLLLVLFQGSQCSAQSAGPSPLWQVGQSVDWWFAFKFNAETFPRPQDSNPSCIFGGTPRAGHPKVKLGQSYVAASSAQPALTQGTGFLGDSTADPLGATFDEVYNGTLSYVVWNDQFFRDPVLPCEGKTGIACGAPWAHAKGLVAWNADGQGLLLQVTTPSWPAAGSSAHPRQHDGNSLGCVDDNNVDLSQHFFALKLTKDDLLKVLTALQTEGAVTDPSNPQIVRSGGPPDVQDAVAKLGKPNPNSTFTQATLSSGVRIIAKGGGLAAPPWQIVSAVLGRVPLRVATFWQRDLIYSTPGRTQPGCWPAVLKPLSPGAVQIALTGTWDGRMIGLTGTPQRGATGASLGANHAKLGVSTDSGPPLTILGDMNQDGTISAKGALTCSSSQNGRGGLFFVMENQVLHDSVAALITGGSAPLFGPAKKSSGRAKPVHTNR